MIHSIFFAIPILAYLSSYIWSRNIIHSKFVNIDERKKYTKYYDSTIGEILAPLWLFFTIVSVFLFPPADLFVGWGLMAFILQIIILIVRIACASLIFQEIKNCFISLRDKSAVQILREPAFISKLLEEFTILLADNKKAPEYITDILLDEGYIEQVRGQQDTSLKESYDFTRKGYKALKYLI